MNKFPDATLADEGQTWRSSIAPVALTIIALLLAAFLSLPYAFYVFLRVLTTGVAVYLAVRAHSVGRNAWTWIFAGVAITYNPIFPLKMGREDWVYFNFAGAFLLAAWLFVTSGKLQQNNRNPK